MDEVDVSINKSRDSFVTDEETSRCDDSKTDNREEIAASTLSSADENVLLSNGLHESISCEEEDGRPYKGDEESNSDAAVCSSDAHVTSGCKATLQTKLRSKTNGELRTAPCCIDVGVDDDHETVVAHESMSNETADASCKTIPEDSKIIESNNHLLELMEFLQAPMDCSRNVKIDDHTITIDSSDNNVKIDKTPKLPSQCAILTRLLASGHSSPTSEIHNDEVDISEDHDLISERDHLENTPVTDSNSNGSDQALSFENRISRDLSATRETSFDGCDINSSSPVISITNQDDSNIVKDQSHLYEVPPTSPSRPPECDDDDMTDSSESTNKSIGHVDVPQASPAIDCYSATITTCPTSTISLPTSHRPLKKRIGLENILLRRLLLAAKPVNHHSTDVLSEEQISDLSEDMDIGENLTSLKSVQVLTNYPQSITILQNEPDTNKTVKEILEHNSIMGDDQMSCDDSENNSKRLHKRKCSSPHRIVKKSLIKTEEDGEIDKLVNVSSPQMSPTSLISKEIPCIPSLSTMTSAQNTMSNIQIPHTKISPLPNAVPFLPGLSMNVITIAPDENYVEPTSFLKQKHPPVIKPLRQLAPKSSCNPTPSQKNISNNICTNILTSKHITAPTNVIPISLVQNTTNPPLVILVNKADTKCTQFISAQPFQLQAHLPQQVSIADQIKPPNVSISNIVPGLLTMRSPQAQHLLKSQPVLSQQQQISFPQTVLSGRSKSNSMPKLKLISDKTSSKIALSSSSPNVKISPDSNLENFFEPFRNNCIVGKFVAPVVDSSKITSGEGCSSSEKFVCGSCGCTYSSETALKEHYQRKSFLVTFQCSCQSGEAARPSTFYNLCSFSTHYRHHVLQHPYVPHSPANSYKVTSLPHDQLSDECLKLMKEKSLVLSQEQQTMSEEPAKTTPSTLHFSEPLNPKKEEVRQTLQCKECCKEFRLPLRIKQHFQNKVAMKSSISEKGDAASNSFRKCPKCDIFLPSSCSFRAHSRLHDSSEPYVCPECGLTFSTFEVMKEHAYKICHHGCRRTGIKGCQFCNFIPRDSASFSESLDLHILKVHKSSSFKCKFCPELFKDIVSAHKHSQLKHGVIIKDSDLQIINKCPVCELQLNCPIEMHVSTHDVESKSKIFYFSCTECSRNFGHRADLEKHLRSTGHLGMKVNGFVCKLCALTFPSREDRCNHITTEHPNLKDMFFSEINNYDLPSLPLIGRREVVSPSNLFAVKSMPNLRLIDPNTTHGVSSNENIQELESISYVPSCNADMRLSCSDASKNNDRILVANSDGASEVPPERWECSRCNEIFVNKATFHRHQQKHRFLEMSKTKKRKLNANSEMPSDKVVCLVAPSMTNTVENNDVVAASATANLDLVCNASGDDVNNIGVSRQSSPVSANQELEEDAAVNDHGSANASSIDLTEHKASLKGATEINCKILPHRFQRQQLQQLPELLEHLPPYLKSDDEPAKDGLSNKWNSCQLCCMSFKSSQKLEHHVAVRHEGLNLVKPETFTCAYCPDSNKRVFVSTRHLHRHLKVRHKIIRSKTGQYMSLDASKTDTNQQKGFTSPDTRDGEESSAEGKCSSEPFPTSPFSEDHGNACLDDSSAAIEDVDDDKTKDPENIKSRKIFGNSEDVYACSYCDHACSNRSTFWEHIISHKDLFGSAVIKNNKTYQCPECGSMFVVRIALFRHLKLVHRIFSEQEYESELDQFKSFRANFCESVESSKLHNQEESVTPKACRDLPADKLAKLAAIRPEDIHNGVTNAPQTPFFPVETSSDCMSQRRKGLRSQIKSESMECSSNPDQGSNSSGEFHDPLLQNECQVCYRSFDSQVELKQHMRVHGMAFIQGTRRNLTNANQSQAGETSPTQTPTNLKAIVA